MGEVGEEVEANVVTEKQFKESSMNLETASTNFRTIYEAVKSADVCDK